MMQIHCEKGQTILQACRKQGISVDGTCGGKGSCGKCKVKVMLCDEAVSKPGAAAVKLPAPSPNDIRLLTGQELQEGYRLACTAVPDGDCMIEFPNGHGEEMAVVTRSNHMETGKPENSFDSVLENNFENNFKNNFHEYEYAIVADIGTTTIAMQLIAYDERGAGVIATHTAANRQRSFGADVISRIEASNAGQGDALKEMVLGELAEGICQLLTQVSEKKKTCSADGKLEKSTEVDSDSPQESGAGLWKVLVSRGIRRLVMAGNTTMVHLLMGYSCETLGKAPFRPVHTDSIRMQALNLLGAYLSDTAADLLKGTDLYVFPGISAFVGGDIVAGLYETGFYKSAAVQMLLDLGTNGEIVIGNRMRMLAASTAAGPAFEGGGICCGTAGVRGAICGCRLSEDGSFELRTIGDAKPVGICGSGLIDILYELMAAGRMDETGLLDGGESERIDLYGKEIYLTQQDIRQFQMAKAAVRAGIETLAREYGMQTGEIECIYVAGGFGYSINLEKAAALGLFPEECRERLVAIGNSSLAGCRRFLTEKDETKPDRIRKYAMQRNLAEHDFFKEEYFRQMYFSEFEMMRETE